jgi:myo-inositol-1(or 4)-monophosphatase
MRQPTANSAFEAAATTEVVVFERIRRLASEVRRIGAELSSGDRLARQWSAKDSAFDIFCPDDRTSEYELAGAIGRHFPADGILAEEGLRRTGDGGAVWAVDPIDGTVNYVKGDRTWGLSLGRMVGGRMDQCVLVYPELGTEVVAVAGHGAFHNGRRLGIPPSRGVDDAVICTKFGNSAARRVEHAEAVGEALREVRDVRRSGCSSWDILQVALGIWDGYAGSDVYLWDYAAAVLVLTEVGGVWSEPAGRDGERSPLLLAAMPPMHAWLGERFGRLPAQADRVAASSG